MGPDTERDLAGGAPCQIEAIRIRKLRGIAIAGGQHEDHTLTARDGNVSDS
jgi:hypothetical protein